MSDYREFNRANWDERAPAHADSPGYAMDRFEADPEFLSHVVRFDVPRLGDIRGLRGPHLQCHIGTDTVSLSRLGARMSGLDFSSASIEQARIVAARARADVDFVVSDVYDAVAAVGAGGFELLTALLNQGLVITGLEEHRSVPWLALPGQMVHHPADDEWQLSEGPERMPLTYTLQAVTPL